MFACKLCSIYDSRMDRVASALAVEFLALAEIGRESGVALRADEPDRGDRREEQNAREKAANRQKAGGFEHCRGCMLAARSGHKQWRRAI